MRGLLFLKVTTCALAQRDIKGLKPLIMSLRYKRIYLSDIFVQLLISAIDQLTKYEVEFPVPVTDPVRCADAQNSAKEFCHEIASDATP